MLYAGDNQLDLKLKGAIYALDSTIVDLCITTFWWATFRTTKYAVKMHTLFDLKTSIPEYAFITEGAIHDVNMLDRIDLLGGSYLVIDREYIDYGRLHSLSKRRINFVVRSKRDIACKVVGSRSTEKDSGINRDDTIVMTGNITAKWHPYKLRMIIFHDKETQRNFIFLTNSFKFSAATIAELYKSRWGIDVSREGHIVQSVRVRPRLKDPNLVAWEASWREPKTVKPSDKVFIMENIQHYRLQRTVNVEVASLHAIPVAETVDNVRRQQELTEKGLIRQFSPAGYQRWHVVKDYVETGEALDTRRRKIVEEAYPITLIGKWMCRYQGGGLGCSTVDRRAAKHARRKGPRLMSTPLNQSEAGVR